MRIGKWWDVPIRLGLYRGPNLALPTTAKGGKPRPSHLVKETEKLKAFRNAVLHYSKNRWKHALSQTPVVELLKNGVYRLSL